MIGRPESMHGASVALLGQFMAATFAPAGNNQGGTMTLAEAVQPSDQSPLTTLTMVTNWPPISSFIISDGETRPQLPARLRRGRRLREIAAGRATKGGVSPPASVRFSASARSHSCGATGDNRKPDLPAPTTPSYSAKLSSNRRENTRYAVLFEHGGLDKGSGIALRSTRHGCRVAKTSGRCSTPS